MASVGLTVSIAGCSGDAGGGPSSPENVTRAYLSAYYLDGEYEKALSYTAGQEKDKITEKMVAQATATETEFNITNVEISNDTAAVTYDLAAKAPVGTITSTATVLLIKRNGKWLVVNDEAEDNAPPEQANSYI